MEGGFVPCSAALLRNRQSASASASTFMPRHAVGVGSCSRRARIAVMAAAPVEVTEDSFQAEVLDSDIPVLVDFYAAWCGPCKLVSPLMDLAAVNYEGKLKVVKIDTEVNKTFVDTYNIRGLPTFAAFKSGKAYGIQEGALGKDGLKAYIEKHCLD